MTRASKATVVGVILAFMLSSCAIGPTEVVQPPPSPAVLEPRSATGTFTSIDGQTTGTFEVDLKVLAGSDELEASDAKVRLFNLAMPYEYITVGGSLEPRGEDPCFDVKTRAASGQVFPDESGSAAAIMPGSVQGFFLYEIVLYLDHTQVDSETSSCINEVVARAPLTWND